MAGEGRRKKRGHRRGRGRGQPSTGSPEERPKEGQPEAAEESDAHGVLPSRLRFRLGRRGDEGKKPHDRRSQDRKKRRTTATPAVSPLSFWRTSRTRTHRKRPMPKNTMRRTLRRIGGLHFPPWVPVAVIIAVVFGILGALFFVQSASAGPRVGDHWHATYETVVCGEPQPNVRQWSGGVHTHSDGILHLHPNTPSEEGTGARLVKWFEYGGEALGTGAKLTQDELQLPGQREVWKNGDECPDGTKGVLQVFVNGVKMDDWSRYIPQDGDQIRIVFGPEEEGLLREGIQIPAEEATREITVEAADRGQPALDSFFDPDAVSINVGETVKVNVNNTGTVTHNLRITGVDQEYGTADDFIAAPADQASALIKPGDSAFTVVRIDEAGQYAFRCDIHPNVQIGTLIVRSEQSSSSQEETPAAEGTPAE